jgi:hypothetical protein
MGRIFVRDQDVHQATSRRADVGEGFLDVPAYPYPERDPPYLPEIQTHDPLVEFQRNHLAFEGDVRADEFADRSLRSHLLKVAAATEQTSRGQFWAELSAFTGLAMIVPVIVGWLTQKHVVRGLTSGAVK